MDALPEEILFVGDHPEMDVAGAATCGFKTCWVNADPSLDFEPPCDYQIASITEIESLCLT